MWSDVVVIFLMQPKQCAWQHATVMCQCDGLPARRSLSLCHGNMQSGLLASSQQPNNQPNTNTCIQLSSAAQKICGTAISITAPRHQATVCIVTIQCWRRENTHALVCTRWSNLPVGGITLKCVLNTCKHDVQPNNSHALSTTAPKRRMLSSSTNGGKAKGNTPPFS